MLPSVQLYSVREALAEDPRATLQTLRDGGFERVEPFGLAENGPALMPLLAELSLAAPTTHASLLSADDPQQVLDLAAQMGVGTVIDPFWNPEDWSTADRVASVADRLNALVEPAQKAGVSIGYHNHAFELANRIDGRPALEVLADHLDPAVALEVDTYWAAVGGADPAELLRTLGERVRFVHLKDGPVSHDANEQLPLGQGAMDVPTLLATAPWLELGVIEFDEYAGDVLEGVVQSLRYLDTLEDAEATR